MRADHGVDGTPYCGDEAAAIASSRDGGAALIDSYKNVRRLNFYVRQFRDMKVIPDGQLITPYLVQFAEQCGAVLARARRSGTSPARSERQPG